jgi:predicted dehydrogenase
MLKIGIIGAGIICESHVRSIERMENVSLKAIADIVVEKALAFTEPLGANAYVDYKEMIEKEDLDAVIINLPHKLHREATLFAAEHGAHVLVEKPMAANSEDCKAMIKGAEENNVKLMIAHIQRYFSHNIKVKELVDSGELGDLVAITDTRNIHYFHDKRPRWFLDKEIAGGGIFMNLGAHCLDKIIWTAGSKVKKIEGKATYHEKRFNVEGSAQAFLELENGVTASITCTGYKVPPYQETHYYFTNGAIKKCDEGLLVSRETGPFEKIELEGNDDAFFMQLKDFIDSIQENKEPAIPGEYGLEVIQAIEKVYSF